MSPGKLTARDVAAALYRHFSPRWAMLTEVTARPRYTPPAAVSAPQGTPTGELFSPPAPRQVPTGKARRIDVLLLRAADVDGGIERLAVEVKVTRSDFLSDVRNPDKQAPWRELAHRHAYAVPKGLVAVAEVPAESGLLTVESHNWGYAVDWARQAKKPTGHNPGPMPLANIMDAFWRAGRAEAHMKALAGGSDEHADAEQLRAETRRLRHEMGLLHNRIDREVEQRERWQRAFAAVGLPACATCGRPLHLNTRKRRASDAWEHRNPADASACEVLRRAEAELRNSQLPQEQRQSDRWLWVPSPEPAELTDRPEENHAHPH